MEGRDYRLYEYYDRRTGLVAKRQSREDEVEAYGPDVWRPCWYSPFEDFQPSPWPTMSDGLRLAVPIHDGTAEQGLMGWLVLGPGGNITIRSTL